MSQTGPPVICRIAARHNAAYYQHHETIPRALLAVTCWALVAWGQQPALVGLPEYGVTLEGLVDNPSVVNTSGKAILAYTVWFRNAQGTGPLEIVLETRDLRHGITHTGPIPDNGIQMQTNSGGPVVEARLDAVVFDDGEYVGPDVGQNFLLLSAILTVSAV